MSIITKRGNLSEMVVAKLLERIDAGIYLQGEKLPSSAQFCEEFGVSRTVVREALASLKNAGRVIVRQGSGVFISDKDVATLNFEIARIGDVRSAMQILELRLGVEQQSVALAAARRTPETLAEIIRAYDYIETLEAKDAEAEAQADFAFHLAIARATRNPHFSRFLDAVMREISFDLILKRRHSNSSLEPYLKKINKEHAAILAAISQGDPEGAKAALTRHLEESLNRYRALLAETTNLDSAG